MSDGTEDLPTIGVECLHDCHQAALEGCLHLANPRGSVDVSGFDQFIFGWVRPTEGNVVGPPQIHLEIIDGAVDQCGLEILQDVNHQVVPDLDVGEVFLRGNEYVWQMEKADHADEFEVNGETDEPLTVSADYYWWMSGIEKDGERQKSESKS